MLDDLDKDPAPTGLDGDETDLLQKFAKALKRARQHQGEWRKQAEEDYAYVAGDQWTAEDRERLKEQLRPVITFNRIQPIIDSVAGTEVGNRMELRFMPRQEGDAGVNELLTGAAEWVRDQCDAEDEESDAFWDTLVCGLGWTETRLDYEQDPDGKILVERIDPLEMYWDPGARKRNLDDGRFVIRVKLIDKDEAESLWPDKAEELASSTMGGEEQSGGLHIVDPAAWYEDDGEKRDQVPAGKYRVAEYQYRETVIFWRLVDPNTQQIAELSDEQYQALAKKFKSVKMPMPEGVKQRRKKVCRAFISGSTILESGEAPDPEAFTYQCITGKRDRNAGTWYGLVRPMKDPQQWANKFFSQTLHVVNTNAKGGIVAETDVTVSPRKFEEEYAKPEAVTWVTPGAIKNGKIMPKPVGAFPSMLPQMMEFAIGSIRDTSGVNLEMLGMANRDQPGVLEYQRKQAALVVLGTLFDSLRRYRKQQGRVLMYFIQHYISDGRLIKVAQEGGEKYVPLVRQSDTAVYDVIVDDSPTSPNQKEKTWSILQPLMGEIMKMGVPPEAALEIIKASPLPESFTTKLIAAIEKAQEEQKAKGPPVDPAVEKAKADIAIKQESTKADLELQRTKNGQEIELKRATAAADIQLERDKATAQFELEAFKAQETSRLANEHADREHGLAKAKANNELNIKHGYEPDGEDPRAGTKALGEKLDQMGEGLLKVAEMMQRSFQQLADGQQQLMQVMMAPTELERDAKGKALRGRKIMPGPETLQ